MVNNGGNKVENNNSNTNEVRMTPCAYKHFETKLTTSLIKNLETREKMEEEGACPEVLESLDNVTHTIQEAINSIRLAMTQEKASREDEKAIARARREAEKEAKRASKETNVAQRVAKASSPTPQPTVTCEDGPQGPTV